MERAPKRIQDVHTRPAGTQFDKWGPVVDAEPKGLVHREKELTVLLPQLERVHRPGSCEKIRHGIRPAIADVMENRRRQVNYDIRDY